MAAAEAVEGQVEGKLKSGFTWKRFDWRRSANDFRSASRGGCPPGPRRYAIIFSFFFLFFVKLQREQAQRLGCAADRDVMIAIFR